MTSKAALALALLKGEVITIKTGFTNFGITNVPREISRSIEKPFGVLVSRTRKDGVSRYKVPCFWFEYRLNRTEYNLSGISLMQKYILDQSVKTPRTEKEAKEKTVVEKLQLF